MSLDSDLSEEELKDISVRMNKPIIFNYFVGPHVPEGAETLLSPEGEPFMLRYGDLNWKKLAERLQKNLQDEGFPKGVKVYVGNDAIDLFDMNRICVRSGGEVDNYDAFERSNKCFSQAKIANFRAGIASIPEIPEGLHLNPSPAGRRPPIAALFISIRLAKVDQAIDYLSSATETVIGLPDSPRIDCDPDIVLGDCPMPTAVAEWLREDVGAVYGDQCTIVRLPVTLSDV